MLLKDEKEKNNSPRRYTIEAIGTQNDEIIQTHISDPAPIHSVPIVPSGKSSGTQMRDRWYEEVTEELK